MKLKRRKASILICAVSMVLSLMQVGQTGITSVRAEGSDNNSYGVSNPRIVYNYHETVTFGNYWQEDTDGNGKLSYSSSNKKVAKVSSDGKVTLKGIGKATITIKTKQNEKYSSGTKKIIITVKPPKVKLLKCTALSDCRVKLSWTASPAFDGYEIQLSQDSAFSDGYNPNDFNKKDGSTILRSGSEGRTWYVRVRPYTKVNGKKK